MGEKLDLRTAKFHIIGTSEPAPEVGSVSEKKDTLFIKQVSSTEFEVYASDDKGKVVRLEKGVHESRFKEFLFRYITENIGDFRNVLNFGKKTGKELDIELRYGIDSARVKLIKPDGLTFDFELDKSKKLCMDDGDRVYVDGSSVESGYMVANGVVYGSNITGLVEVSVVDRLYFGEFKGAEVNENDGHIINNGGEGISLSISGYNLSEGYNRVNKGVINLDYIENGYGSYVIRDGIGNILHTIEYRESGSITIDIKDVLFIDIENFVA